MASKFGFFLTTLFIIKVVMAEKFPAEHSYYTHISRSGPYNKTYFPFCEHKPHCICNKEGQGYVFHCENEFHLELVMDGHISVTCNNTFQEQNLSYDFYSMMGLENLVLQLSLRECPVPTKSYASLFGPRSSQSSNTTDGENISSIVELYIYCGDRQEFSIAKEHLEGLSELNEMGITCGALMDLPSDLFHGEWPHLNFLMISDIRIERIPEGFFSKLSKLETLDLYRNRFLELKKQDFFGLSSLKVLKITENQLSSLEADVFDYITSLEYLELSDIKITNLPKSFARLENLKQLMIGGSSIKSIDAGDCSGLSNLQYISIVNNRMTFIHPECFAYFKNSSLIYISGNSLSSLPDEAIIMNELTTFQFNHNSEIISHLGQFIVSERLWVIELVNSSIEHIDPEFLHGLSNLSYVDLSQNKLTTLHADFFTSSPKLIVIDLAINRLSVIPHNIFSRNPALKYLDISSNNISKLSSSVFANSSSLEILNLSKNNLEIVSKSLTSNLRNLTQLNISKNKLKIIEKNSFSDMHGLIRLLLHYNMLSDITSNLFYKEFRSLKYLNLTSNFISQMPRLDIPTLKELNLANNCLKKLEKFVFFNLTEIKSLNLSKNVLVTLPNSPLVTGEQKLITLDLSFNLLSEIPENMLREAKHLKKLDLSGNKIKEFHMKWISNASELRELDLSRNGLISMVNDLDFNYIAGKSLLLGLKILNLSNNAISFKDSSWMYDTLRKTWGRVSPLVCFFGIEELHLANNFVSEIFLDWRNMLPQLRLLDLRHNKFKHLTHQDLLFSSSIVHYDKTVVPYNCTHSLQVDLRHNQIQGVDLPSSMLTRNTRRGCGSRIHSHATIHLDDNPFSCDCGLSNFLRLLNGDVVLTSELWRTEGKDWILPARISAANLTCREPITVRGRKLSEPETWMHHLIPMFGHCFLEGYT